MRVIVFFCNTVNSRYLKVEVRPKLLIFQINFSDPRLFILRCKRFEMHGVDKKINGYKRLQIALKLTVRKQKNLIRRNKFKAQRTTKIIIKQMI